MIRLQAISDFTLNSLFFALLCFLLFAIAIFIGKKGLSLFFKNNQEGSEDFRMVSGALLTLLGLLIGFSMSMAISGYNDRQLAEMNEAVALRGAYLKMDLLPHELMLEGKQQLKNYLNTRILYYAQNSPTVREQLQQQAFLEQAALWQFITKPSIPHSELMIASINEMINAHQKTIGNWNYHVPSAIWLLLMIIGIFCCLLIGYNARKVKNRFVLMLFLPAMLALSFLVIAEIDTPGYGIIHVTPENLKFINAYLIK